MADAFQPRFVDLVRNYTDTIGTGDLVLGEAAPGFTSFSAALQAGDNFYYSVMSLDTPTETEVGRGTLQADGTIARDPVGGEPTNFTAGLKSVALVAAAEWFHGATQFTATAPGSVTRSVAEKSADVISVRDFGALGDAVSDDTPAFTAAILHALASGQALFVPRGTYIVQPGAFYYEDEPNAGRFVMFGEGASSVIKVIDGSITASDYFLLRFTTSADMEVIEIRDLFLDHNARGSPDPAVSEGDAWAYQHSHTIQIAPTAGTIEHVRFSNIVIRDPAADGFNCSHTGTGTVVNYVVNNCAVVDRTRVRSDITFATLPERAVIDGFYGEVIEIECVSPTAGPVRTLISNCNVNRLDIASHSSDWMTGNVELHMANVTAPVNVNLNGVMLRASNCVFGISTDLVSSRWWCLQPGSQISDSLLLHKYSSATGEVGQLQPMSSGTYGWRTNLRLVGCESRIDANGPINSSGAAILGIAGVTPNMLDNANLEVVSHKFDSRFAASVFADRCGRVRLIGNQYGGTVAAVKYQSGAAYAVDVTVEGGDFRHVSGASVGTAVAVVDQVAGIGRLRLHGDHTGVKTPWVSVVANLPSTVYNQLYSNRRMLMDSVPASGVLGDIVELRAPAAGSADSYRCTTPGPTATYKTRTALAA